jgi:calcineurin-like phosphoesterase
MDPGVENPFFTADRTLEILRAKIVVVEIHAEATSEKAALGRYLDGRVSVVYGTHTHIQTSDGGVLPGGTGYVTDIGMTGPVRSVLGMDTTSSIDRFLGKPHVRYRAASGECELQGTLFDIDETSGKCRSVELVKLG